MWRLSDFKFELTPSVDKGLADSATFSRTPRSCMGTNKTSSHKVAAKHLVQKMDHPDFLGYSAPLFDQQNHVIAQHGDDSEDLGPPLTDWCDYEWNYVKCSQIATNIPSQAFSNPEPHPSLIRPWYRGYAASSSFGKAPDADLPLRAVDAECQSSANDQSFQQNLLPWPQPKSTAELNSIPIPYGDSNYESLSGFEQARTAGAAIATQRLGEPHSNIRQSSGRCVRCWALKKPVILFIE